MEIFDLLTDPDLRPSAYCWRAKLALKHKNRRVEYRDTKYSEIPTLGDGSFKTLPVIRDGDVWVQGSGNIAEYLEAQYPAEPTLFPVDGSRRFVGWIEAWVDTSLYAPMFPLIAFDIWRRMFESEQAYFRSTRETRLGKSLELAQQQALASVPELRRALQPFRNVLKTRAFISGEAPAYCDYIVFGALKWSRLFSDCWVFEPDDPVETWFLAIDQRAQPLRPVDP